MVEFLRASEKDLDKLYKVIRNAFDEDKKKYGSGPEYYEDKNKLKYYLSNWICYKAVIDNEIIGGMIIFNLGGGRYRLGAIFIDTEHQNKGIGTKAIEFLEETHKDAEVWELDTPYKNYRDHHFYEKLGYKKVAETVPEKNGFYLFIYEKIIHRSVFK